MANSRQRIEYIQNRWERETEAMTGLLGIHGARTQKNKLTFIESLVGARSLQPVREAISNLFPLEKPEVQKVN